MESRRKPTIKERNKDADSNYPQIFLTRRKIKSEYSLSLVCITPSLESPPHFLGLPGFRYRISGRSKTFSSIIQSLPTFWAGSFPLWMSCQTRCLLIPSLAAASLLVINLATFLLILNWQDEEMPICLPVSERLEIS